MEVRSILSLYFFFLTMIVSVSARACQERLDVLEKVVQSLIKSQKTKLSNNVVLNQWTDEAFKHPKFEKEKHVLEQKLEDLEKSLARANIRIKALETRVSEFELSEKFTKTRSPTKNSKTGQQFHKIKSNAHKMEYPWPGTTAPLKLQNNTEELQSNTSMAEGHFVSSDENARTPKGKRLLTGIQSTTPSTNGAAFSAFISVHETDISKGYTIKFDTVVTNFGNHYNQHTGIFTATEQGVYVFSWNLYCYLGGYFYSQLMVNSNVVGAIYTSAEGATSIRSTTGTVVVHINVGDVVYVRTHPTEGHIYNLYSKPDWRSSFSGWKLY